MNNIKARFIDDNKGRRLILSIDLDSSTGDTTKSGNDKIAMSGGPMNFLNLDGKIDGLPDGYTLNIMLIKKKGKNNKKNNKVEEADEDDAEVADEEEPKPARKTGTKTGRK